MKQTYIVLGGSLVAALIGFFVLNNYIYKEKQGNPAGDFEPYRATLSGTYLCLIARDASAAGDALCVTGLRTEAGEQYLVDFSLMSQTPPPLQIGDTFTASGVVTPIERLSTDQWRSYDVEGVFSVTDSVRKQ